MPTVTFTQQLRRFTEVPEIHSEAPDLRGLLDEAFARNPRLRGYILDDQEHVRPHVAVFVDGVRLRNHADLSCLLRADSRVFVLQALSGG